MTVLLETSTLSVWLGRPVPVRREVPDRKIGTFFVRVNCAVGDAPGDGLDVAEDVEVICTVHSGLVDEDVSEERLVEQSADGIRCSALTSLRSAWMD